MPRIWRLSHAMPEHKQFAHINGAEKFVRFFVVIRGDESEPEIHTVTLSSVIHAVQVTDSLIADQSGKRTGGNPADVWFHLHTFGNKSIVADNVESDISFLADLFKLLCKANTWRGK